MPPCPLAARRPSLGLLARTPLEAPPALNGNRLCLALFRLQRSRGGTSRNFDEAATQNCRGTGKIIFFYYFYFCRNTMLKRVPLILLKEQKWLDAGLAQSILGGKRLSNQRRVDKLHIASFQAM